MLITDKVMGILKNKARFRVYTKEQMQEMLDKNVLLVLDGIASFKCKNGQGIDSLMHLGDIERDAPKEFQERFYCLMDILYPIKTYAELFIAREHPELVYMLDWAFALYINETPVAKKK